MYNNNCKAYFIFWQIVMMVHRTIERNNGTEETDISGVSKYPSSLPPHYYLSPYRNRGTGINTGTGTGTVKILSHRDPHSLTLTCLLPLYYYYITHTPPRWTEEKKKEKKDKRRREREKKKIKEER